MAMEPAPSDKNMDGDDADELIKIAKRYSISLERERENIENAYDDLNFRAGEQWPAREKAQREAQFRPCLTINQTPQFVRQVTGDIRQGRPSIKVVPVDNGGDEEAAELRAGVIRYIENRCDAPGVYFAAADSQVACGIGHWRVKAEYAGETTFNQELAVELIQDGVMVLWDPDAYDPTRKDAEWCFVPIDMTTELFKSKYPDAPVSGFGDDLARAFEGWMTENTVRVVEYWCKKKAKIPLLLADDGSVRDLTDAEPDEIKALRAAGARIEMRETNEIYRSLVTSGQYLEKPKRHVGRYIPIVPCLGEETRIGRRVVRNGLVRAMKDSQRMFNYFASAQAEVVALQPKAPWIGTEKQFERYMDQWETANTVAHPFLTFTPDPSFQGAPQRVAPPVNSGGITEGLNLASENMRAVTGIHQSGLGEVSNEKSGKAIIARQREGDTGTFVYLDNFGRAVRHTGTILLDWMPHIYDTQRTIRIVGEDGKMTPQTINQPTGVAVAGDDGNAQAVKRLNDLTVGAYDVVIEQGPSYTTKREEAKDGMAQLIQSVPEVFKIIGDKFVKAQDWPDADGIAERLEMILPPEIRQAEAQKSGQPMPPQPPNPQAQMAAQQQQLEGQKLQLEHAKLQVESAKIDAELQKAQAEIQKAQIDAQSKAIDAHASVATAKASGQDPRLDSVIQAVQELQHAVTGIAHLIGGGGQPPPDQTPPSPQQPPPGGFFNAPDSGAPPPQ